MTEVICEIEPPTRPVLDRVASQIDVLRPISSRFLVPDNHIGRATVSSLAVAREVNELGGRAIACLNARDRNLLGFRRDLLTAAAYGVHELLLVYGDKPQVGSRSDLTVRTMLEECRRLASQVDAWPLRAGVSARLGPLPAWKRGADFVFVQVSFFVEDLVRWRESVAFDGPAYAGVMVLASPGMARKVADTIPEIHIPESWIAALESDRTAGVRLAAELTSDIEASGAFDGIHLVPGVRYREVAAALAGRRVRDSHRGHHVRDDRLR